MKKIIILTILLVLVAGSGTGFYLILGKLNETQSELQAAQNTIVEQNDLINANSNAIGDLQKQIEVLQTQFKATSQDLVDTKNSLVATNIDLAATNSEKEAMELQLTSYLDGYNNTKMQFEAAQSKIELYQSTYGDISSGKTPADSITDGQIDNQQRTFYLKRNPNALDPTWEQLSDFLQNDLTDQNRYIDNLYTCGNYAEDIFNHAESAGIRAAVVCISFKDDYGGHALNAFKTIDKGLVFIDCTGEPESIQYIRMVTKVDLKIDEDYYRDFVFYSDDGYFGSWGKVDSISLYW
jgi:hypothetical protein